MEGRGPGLVHVLLLVAAKIHAPRVRLHQQAAFCKSFGWRLDPPKGVQSGKVHRPEGYVARHSRPQHDSFASVEL